jgi:hypothetical protein
VRGLEPEAFQFFLDTQFLPFHRSDLEFVMTGMGNFVGNRLFEAAVLFRQLMDVRLKSHGTCLLLLLLEAELHHGFIDLSRPGRADEGELMQENLLRRTTPAMLNTRKTRQARNAPLCWRGVFEGERASACRSSGRM